MLAFFLLALVQGEPEPAVEARWRCEPAAVELGEPFTLVLELRLPQQTDAGALLESELALDDSWVVLGRTAPRFQREVQAPEPVVAELTWSVASLEPGERSLAHLLAGLAFAPEVTRIDAGGAHVSVAGVLAEGEDAPRPLREFPAGFAARSEEAAALRWLAPVALALLVLAPAAGLVFLLRRRRAASAPAPVTTLERLEELERALGEDGERSRATCFDLTRLLRAAADGARGARRDGLTDEEWVAELRTAPGIPRAAVDELAAVLEKAAAVKYGGERPTEWALRETLSRSRVALQAVGAGGAAADGGRG